MLAFVFKAKQSIRQENKCSFLFTFVVNIGMNFFVAIFDYLNYFFVILFICFIL